MKESQQQLERAVIIVGTSLNIKEATEMLLKNVGIHSTIKELTFKMFVLNKNDYFEKDDSVFDSIQLMRRYCKEMSEKGEVSFGSIYWGV